MDKYLQIWFEMKPNQWYTAKQLSVAPATMSAMLNRNMVCAQNCSPKQYSKIISTNVMIYYLLEKYKDFMSNYIDIFCTNRKFAMMCTIKNGIIYDCYDQKFDITHAYKIRIGKRYFSLIDGKEIINNA